MSGKILEGEKRIFLEAPRASGASLVITVLLLLLLVVVVVVVVVLVHPSLPHSSGTPYPIEIRTSF